MGRVVREADASRRRGGGKSRAESRARGIRAHSIRRGADSGIDSSTTLSGRIPLCSGHGAPVVITLEADLA